MSIKEIILKYASKGPCVGIGVSGGADSMVLLHHAVKVCGAKRVVALHIEHGIRGEQSKNDARFVQKECSKLGVKCEVFSADIPALAKENKRSEETEARIYRHEIYKEFAEENGAVVLLGHNKDDRIESILMHILRGCAIRGLVGMSECDGHIVRPLLHTSKAEIVEYAKKCRIPYVEDATNSSLDYDRNYIRGVLIPAINERYDINALIRLSDNAKDNETFVERFVNEENIIMDKDCALIPIGGCFIDKALASRYILKAFTKVGLTADMESKHLNDVFALKDMQNGTKICLPHSFVACKEYDFVSIYKERERVEYEEEFSLGFTCLDLGVVQIFQTDKIPYAKEYLVFDADKIPSNAVIRPRRDGDVFKPFNGKTKKLKDYFIDKKIPVRKRDFIPLIAVDDEVLLVSGVEISDKIKVDEKTSEIYGFFYNED